MEMLALARPDSFAAVGALPLRVKLLAVASLVFVGELALRRFAPDSRAYKRWTAVFAAVGAVWTGILLSVVYALAVGPTGMVTRLFGHRLHEPWRLQPRPTFWQSCEASPLEPLTAARHQF